jgi:hypothetical protein
MISGFRREVKENCALLGYYAASCVNFLHNNEEQRSSQAASCSAVVKINLGIQVKFKLLINYWVIYRLVGSEEEENTEGIKMVYRYS